MAMNMKGEVSLPASRDTVWQKLNDPEVLKLCIPGCESLERTEEGGFAAVAKMKIGPVSATFRGKVELADLDPPNGYRILGAGDGGIAGHARGGAKVALTAESEDQCLLSYEAEANIGGKIAQLGARMIDSVAKKMADQFFEKFAAQVGGESGGQEAQA
jgi:carbon monoxide dehydrogenase subunit G